MLHRKLNTPHIEMYYEVSSQHSYTILMFIKVWNDPRSFNPTLSPAVLTNV